MKKMKKIICLLLAALTVFALCACGSSEKSALDEIKESGVLTVALSPDFSPMEFVDSSKTGQEQYVGFDVMLAQFIADELGVKLEIQAMSFDACQTAVSTASVPMSISGYSWTIYNAGLAEGNPADHGIPTLEEYDWETLKATIE